MNEYSFKKSADDFFVIFHEDEKAQVIYTKNHINLGRYRYWLNIFKIPPILLIKDDKEFKLREFKDEFRVVCLHPLENKKSRSNFFEIYPHTIAKKFFFISLYGTVEVKLSREVQGRIYFAQDILTKPIEINLNDNHFFPCFPSTIPMIHVFPDEEKYTIEIFYNEIEEMKEDRDQRVRFFNLDKDMEEEIFLRDIDDKF